MLISKFEVRGQETRGRRSSVLFWSWFALCLATLQHIETAVFPRDCNAPTLGRSLISSTSIGRLLFCLRERRRSKDTRRPRRAFLSNRLENRVTLPSATRAADKLYKWLTAIMTLQTSQPIHKKYNHIIVFNAHSLVTDFDL